MTTPDSLKERLHSSDLTDECAHRVYLRHTGRASGEVPGALFRGCVMHAALESLHAHHPMDWDADSAMAMAKDSVEAADAQIASEGRRLTESAANGRRDIEIECADMLTHYIDRIGPMLMRCEILGVEVPIHLELVDHEMSSHEFSSHIDLLFRDESGALNIWDWKSGSASPTYDYLSRNAQLGMYALACESGSVMLGDEWVSLIESPTVAWIHLNDLQPYKRKTRAKIDGVEVEYKKGDQRPLDRIVRRVHMMNLRLVEQRLIEWSRMFRAGFFPTNPGPDRCVSCDCVHACESFDQHEELVRA